MLKRAETRLSKAPAKAKALTRFVVWLVVSVLLLDAGYGAWLRFGSHSRNSAAVQPARPQPAPVRVATVEKKDFPIALTGLGTVRATNMVTVHASFLGVSCICDSAIANAISPSVYKPAVAYFARRSQSTENIKAAAAAHAHQINVGSME